MFKTASFAYHVFNNYDGQHQRKRDNAIYHALQKFDYLLRDIQITLQSDHKNLIYINDTASAKVIRWKLAMQKYDFDIGHISGKDYFIADYKLRWLQSRNYISLGAIGRNCGYSTGTVINFTKRVFGAIRSLEKRFLFWPKSRERKKNI